MKYYSLTQRNKGRHICTALVTSPDNLPTPMARGKMLVEICRQAGLDPDWNAGDTVEILEEKSPREVRLIVNPVSGALKVLPLEEYRLKFDPSAESAIMLSSKLPGAEALVMFTNMDLSSSNCGDRTSLVVGPGRSWKLEDLEKADCRLGDLPSTFQYPTAICFLPKHKPVGVEAMICDEIARRQQVGLAKYGQSVADNPLELADWLQHALEELLDAAVYVKRAKCDIEKKINEEKAS